MSCCRIVLILLALGGVAPMVAHAQDRARVEVDAGELPAHIQEKIESLLTEERPPESRFEARRQARRAADMALKALNSEGYFNADALIDVDPGPPVKPTVKLNPGGRFAFNDVQLAWLTRQGEPTSAPLPELSTRITTGQPVRADDIISEERRLVKSLRSLGHADAKALPRNLVGDREAQTVDLTYRLAAGPKVCIGSLAIEGDSKTRPSFVERLSPLETGKIHDGIDVAELERRLQETRLFAIASTKMEPSAEQTAEGCETRDVIVTLADAPSRTLALGASYATTEGPGLQADWEQRNFSGRGDTLATRLNLAELERSLGLSWTQPAFGGYGRSLILSTGIGQETTDAYDRFSVGLNALYDYRWSRYLDLTGGVGFEFAREEEDELKRDLHILTGLAGLRWDDVDDALDPTQGFRFSLQGEPSYVIGDLDGPLIRVTTEGRGYVGFADDSFVMAGRAKLGTVYGADVAVLPVEKRFYAGGGGSVRGYAYQGVGPVDDEGDPSGGRSLVELGIEGRWRLTERFGMAIFVDAGEVGAAEAPRFSSLRAGAGAGFRYFTGFGPLRVDLATPLDPQDGDEPLHVYISIGQAY